MKNINEKLIGMVIGIICMAIVFVVSGCVNVPIDAPEQSAPTQQEESAHGKPDTEEIEVVKPTETTVTDEKEDETPSASEPEPTEDAEIEWKGKDITKQESVPEAPESPESVPEDTEAPLEDYTENSEDDVVESTAPVFTVLDEMSERGNIGRLTIPTFGVDVALFDTSLYNFNHSQAIVDAIDSAAYISDTVDTYGFVIVGDHVYQGFDAIKQVSHGTILYIDKGACVESYVCTDIFIGYNGYGNKGGMFDINGNSVVGRNDGGLCLYTCNYDETITITFWQPV